MTYGSNSPINQNINQSFNYGLTEQRIDEIKHGMELIQKEEDTNLRKKYPIAYFLFTVTKFDQIIPAENDLPNLFVDWTGDATKIKHPNYKTENKPGVKVEEDKLTLTTPMITFDGLEFGFDRFEFMHPRVGAGGNVYKFATFAVDYSIIRSNSDG